MKAKIAIGKDGKKTYTGRITLAGNEYGFTCEFPVQHQNMDTWMRRQGASFKDLSPAQIIRKGFKIEIKKDEEVQTLSDDELVFFSMMICSMVVRHEGSEMDKIIKQLTGNESTTLNWFGIETELDTNDELVPSSLR